MHLLQVLLLCRNPGPVQNGRMAKWNDSVRRSFCCCAAIRDLCRMAEWQNGMILYGGAFAAVPQSGDLSRMADSRQSPEKRPW